MDQVTYEPGNGTRYILLVSTENRLGPEFGEVPIVLIWVNPLCGPSRAGVFSRNNYLHYTYLQEKMQITSIADTAAILAFLRTYGISVGMPSVNLTGGKYASN